MPDIPISADESTGAEEYENEPLSQPAHNARPRLTIRPVALVWPSIAIVLGIYWAFGWILDRLAPDAGESLALRWSRAFVDHPLRSPMTLYLTLLTIAGGRRSSGER